MADYYDYVLGLVPISMVLVAALLIAAGIQLFLAVSAGGSVAAVVVGHALFVNSPTSAPTPSDVVPTSTDSSPTPAYSGAGAD
jgi:hypothetical protein